MSVWKTSALAPNWIIMAGLFATSAAHALPAPSQDTSVTATGERRIRVRLSELAPTMVVRGFDLRLFAGPGGNSAATTDAARRPAASPDRVSEWEIRCNDGRIRATPVRVAGKAAPAPLDVAEPLEIETPAGFLNYGHRPYRDRLVIWASFNPGSPGRPGKPGAGCEVVNEVGVEKYLDGLVNAEFSAKWNEESIAAQVIAARTYALHQIRAARAPIAPGQRPKHFDVDATDRDQVYDGSMREDYRASRGVERTRGQVLTVPGTQDPIKAFYHSTCGGGTEYPQRVWGLPYPGFKRVVACPFCASSPRFKWDLSLTGRELRARLLGGARAMSGNLTGWPRDWRARLGSATLMDLRLAGKDARGRVGDVLTYWSLPRSSRQASAERSMYLELHVPATRFREWVGAGQLRSTLFDVTRSLTLAQAPGSTPLSELGSIDMPTAPAVLPAAPVATADPQLGPVSVASAAADARVNDAPSPKNPMANSEPVVASKRVLAEHLAPGMDSVFKFRGRGFGHGVGMCQWGAKVMGERGYKVSAILKQYYPDAVVKKLW